MPVNTADLKKLKVTELRDQLSSRGLDTKGVKDELITRLAAALEAEEGEGAPAAAPAVAAAPPAADIAQPVASAPAPVASAAPVAAVSPAAVAAPAPVAAAPAAPSAAEILASGKPILAEVDKRKMRAERFGGAVSPTDGVAAKKAAASTAAIGGLGHFDPAEEYERRKKRAERFGLPIPVSKAEESLKKKARADRFGIEVPMSAAEIEAKKKARADRFAATGGAAPGSKKAEEVKLTEEEKKKLEERAKRFAPVAQS
jgi:hypothetical protein